MVPPVRTAAPEPRPVATDPAEILRLEELVEAVRKEGSAVSIEVIGADAVMTEAECRRLRALPVSEQLMVTLASIGLEDAIGAAARSQGVSLSGEASGLIAEIMERRSALPEEERLSVRERLRELFPVRKVMVDGVRCTCCVIDLCIAVDGVERVEQYAVGLDADGLWIFIRL